MSANEHVVLIHGLWMHGVLLRWMARRIARAGYTVHCYAYASVRTSLAENTRRLAAYCHALDAKPLHLVGHSLGGLLIARLLDMPHRLDIGRVVMLGSPFVDSFAARRLGRWRIGRAAMGASVAEWLQGARPASLARYPVGVIAGDRGMGLGVVLAPDLPAPHDGTICVAETVVPGASDAIVLPVSHTQMVMSALVVRQVCAFLRHGRFARSASA
jgi:pimeloyl-ACP methyl ester carboxylesterase